MSLTSKNVGRDAGSWVVNSPLEEASLVSAYALAQTTLENSAERRRLSDAFDTLVAYRQELSSEDTRRLLDSRERVDRIYLDHRAGPMTAPDAT